LPFSIAFVFMNTQYAFRGHAVALCDQNTASDGEAVIEGFNGQDAPLDAATEHLLDEIRNDPGGVPPPPRYTDKSFKYPKRETNWSKN
jgi:hypothetical protein